MIDDALAAGIIARMLYLQDEDPKAPLTLLVDSVGGSVPAGLAVMDTMERLKPPVHICCEGRADSLAAIVVTCGTKGCRRASRGATFSLGDPWTPNQGEVAAQEVVRLRDLLVKIVATRTGRSADLVREDFAKEKQFTAQEALEYGLIDEVVE